jgi:hypothetical protein
MASLFDWFKKKTPTDNPVKVPRKIGVTRDFTESLQVNRDLTKGLYFGDYPGLKLASALAAAPIKIPVYFQGFPTAKTTQDDLDEILSDIIDRFNVQIQQAHIESQREGTIWVWPKWDAVRARLYWEFIPDQYVTDIIRDLETGEPIQIIVQEALVVSTGFGLTSTVTRTRVFTAQSVEVKYSGQVPAGLKSKSQRNPIGTLPIPLAHEPDGDELRGHSVYGRILSDLKGYHDTDLAMTDNLSKFKTKLLAGVSSPDDFAVAQGYNNAADLFTNFDLWSVDMILYLQGKEAPPSLLTAPVGSIQAYTEALKIKFRKIIEGSGIPEIAWGLKTEGNLASVEENMAALMMYVKGLQREVTGPWEKIFTASLKLTLIATMGGARDFEIRITWNDLDAMSDKTKAEVFRNFCEGLSKIMSTASVTKAQLYRLWKLNYPNVTEEEFEEFSAEINKMGIFKVVTSASDPMLARDAMGLDDAS